MIFCFFQTGATRIFHGFRWDQGTKPVSPVYPTWNGIFFLRRFLVLFVSDQCFQIWIQLPKIWAPTTCTCVCYFGLQWPPVKFVDPPVNHLLTRNPRKNPDLTDRFFKACMDPVKNLVPFSGVLRKSFRQRLGIENLRSPKIRKTPKSSLLTRLWRHSFYLGVDGDAWIFVPSGYVGAFFDGWPWRFFWEDESKLDPTSSGRLTLDFFPHKISVNLNWDGGGQWKSTPCVFPGRMLSKIWYQTRIPSKSKMQTSTASNVCNQKPG